MRADGRSNTALRPISFEMGYLKHHPGSVMVTMGDTKVLCLVTSENRVPPHRFDIGGWLSAEYNMLPGATNQRKPRAIQKLKNDGRSVEISRLIGRALRQAVNIDALGQKTLLIDCDVIQADAGTRAAAITGSYLAACAHVASLIKTNQLRMVTLEDIIVRPVAAVSLGILKDQVLLDLTYQEDVKADTDCNMVASHRGEIVEFQCSAEQKPLTKKHLDEIYEVGLQAISHIIEAQKKALLSQCGILFHH